MSTLVVVKVSGRPVDDPGACAGLWSALASAAEQARLVVVHGGGVAVDRRLAQLGLVSERRDGLRVTPDEHIGVVTGVLAGEVNRRLVGVLSAAGVDAVGIGVSDAGLCACEPIAGLGRVGRVAGGDGRVIAALHGAGIVPVVHSIGADADGGELNVNADDAAAGVAAAASADRLVLLTDVAGVLDADGNTIDELDAARVDGLIASGVIAGGMCPKARAALGAGEACGAEVVIGSWHDAAALIGGAEGTGTRVRRRRPIGAAG
ncbi:MAG: acetylglutamate kinase [Phycisphaeraceae bacterium]|nr:MAG: acetylglutamate kinase [Phycisphaeraceae bacterium]